MCTLTHRRALYDDVQARAVLQLQRALAGIATLASGNLESTPQAASRVPARPASGGIELRECCAAYESAYSSVCPSTEHMFTEIALEREARHRQGGQN